MAEIKLYQFGPIADQRIGVAVLRQASLRSPVQAAPVRDRESGESLQGEEV
jgi:hypothetical protein